MGRVSLVGLALLSLACRTAPAPRPPEEAEAEDARPEERTPPARSVASGGWVDPNALPKGATARFGDKRFIGNAPVGLLSDGRIVSTRGHADVVVDFIDEENRYRALVVDLEGRTLLHEFVMPDSFESVAIDGSGRVLTVTDSNTVLLYELR